MPTYDYQCKECGYAFEEFQTMTAESLVVCPSCNKPGLKRIVTGGAGMIFKGTGFYLTDYKNAKTSTSESKSSAAKPSDSSSGKESAATAKKPDSPSSGKQSDSSSSKQSS